VRQALSEAGFANIFANFLGQGLERLVEDDPALYTVADLPTPLLEACCNNLRIRSDFDDVYLLNLTPSDEQHLSLDALLARIDLEEEPHMVLFLPKEAREGVELPIREFTPVDTFRNMEIMEEQMIQRINKMPVYKRVATLWSQHAMGRIPILKRLEYLINIISLCLEAEDMGQFYHQLDLLPDRNPDVTENFVDRLTRNMLAVTVLCNHGMPLDARLAALHLTDADMTARLNQVLSGLGEFTPTTLAAALYAEELEAPGLSFDNWHFAEESGWS
jgi:hypothetical protein